MKKNVILLFDEMKVKAGLIFNRSTEKLTGFVELGKFSTSNLLFLHCIFLVMSNVYNHMLLLLLCRISKSRG